MIHNYGNGILQQGLITKFDKFLASNPSDSELQEKISAATKLQEIVYKDAQEAIKAERDREIRNLPTQYIITDQSELNLDF